MDVTFGAGRRCELVVATASDSRCKSMGYQLIWKKGEVREWLNRAVSKTVEPLRVPWVRIPPSPPEYLALNQ